MLGSPKTDNMYHAGWAWAGGTPFKGTKLLGAYFGGTRNPMVISWPARIAPDAAPRRQFHHVVDIAPTIYDVLNIPHPEVVNGQEQIPVDGVSIAYTFDDADAETEKDIQFFDNNGSRGIYKGGWFACTFGPFTPWDSATSATTIPNWDSAEDVWELYDLRDDFSQADDLAGRRPDKLEEMKRAFLAAAEENQDFPIGAGNWLRIHPEDRIKTPYTEWAFTHATRRMPEFTAPGIGRESTSVVLDIEVDGGATGVLYAVGGSAGGLTVFMDNGRLHYEYNMLLIETYAGVSDAPLPAGRYSIRIDTDIAGPGQPGTAMISVDGGPGWKVDIGRTVPAAFSATETLDVGIDLGSPVSTAYADRAPFEFSGTIRSMKVSLPTE